MSKLKPENSHASGPQAPLPKDPQPTVDRIDELARRILSGDILLPKFQREFVWERGQILMLWDSISRGYPIGSILLWQSREELRSENHIADLQIQASKPDYPVNYLLDGQQRLSTICGAMFWNGEEPESPWNIVYDLSDDTFVHLNSLIDPPLHQIRLNKLQDATEYFKHVASLDTLKSKEKAVYKERAERFFNRFKDYKVASVTLAIMPLKSVAPIFERINSQGTPLTIVDLMRAATWSPEFDLIEGIDAIRDELSAKGFHELDNKVVLRSLSAATGGGFSVDSIEQQLRTRTVDELKAGIEALKESYKRTVDFLTTQAAIPSPNVLPYSNQLTVLSEIFRRIPIPNAAQYAEINNWFWRTSHTGYFGGWNTGMMSSDLKSVEAFANGKATTVKINISPPSDLIWNDRTFRLNNAHSKLLAIILGRQLPLDLLTGQVVDVSKALAWTNAKEFHHLFPQAYLTSLGVPLNRINSLANIIIVTSATNKSISDRSPSDYFKDVQSAAGSNLKKWLDSHLIPEEAFQAALVNDYENFLKIRSKSIDEAARKLANW